MKGRIWLVIGAAAGVAIGLGKIPYLAGAAGSLSDTAQHVVGTGGLTLVHSVARSGASRRVVQGVMALLAVLVPGITALLLVVAARTSLRLRAVVAFLLVALGVAAFFYLPAGAASGAGALALGAATIAVVATGPLVAAPLVALAALIATAFLPRLLATQSTLPNIPVATLHQALFASPGSPLWLRIVVLLVAVVPFLLSGRLLLR